MEILAAEQTPQSTSWFQGTADAVRKAQRHFIQHDADHYLILAGDHLYRMDYARAARGAPGTPAPTSRLPRCRWNAEEATGMGIFTFDRQGAIARL